MTASDQGTEEASSSVASAPAAVFAPSRRISSEAYGVKKLPKAAGTEAAEVDDFGLPIKRRTSRASSRVSSKSTSPVPLNKGPDLSSTNKSDEDSREKPRSSSRNSEDEPNGAHKSQGTKSPEGRISEDIKHENGSNSAEATGGDSEENRGRALAVRARSRSAQRVAGARSRSLSESVKAGSEPGSRAASTHQRQRSATLGNEPIEEKRRSRSDTLTKISESGTATTVGGVSEWSHQALAPRKEEVIEEKEEEWQAMPALDRYDYFDDEGHLIAKGNVDPDDDDLDAGGAGKGYTRVQIDDDAKSATSMDENTSYLFKEKGTNVVDEDEDQRDPLAQMQATKDLLTEGQRIAYVGVVRLAMIQMLQDLEKISSSKAVKKELGASTENLKMWSQKMMVRLYSHMDIDAAGRQDAELPS